MMIQAGRRKRGQPPAPYQSQLCRVPVPVKDEVMGIIRDFRAKAQAEAREQRNQRP